MFQQKKQLLTPLAMTWFGTSFNHRILGFATVKPKIFPFRSDALRAMPRTRVIDFKRSFKDLRASFNLTKRVYLEISVKYYQSQSPFMAQTFS